MQVAAYKTPFAMRNGVIYDASGAEVRLWGVNYYAPFNHNYINMKEMGVDHCRAVDRDLADLEALGVNFIRMHLFDREITDAEGNLLDNDHMRVFDYLLDRMEEKGFIFMLTAVAWWNSVENQVTLDQGYAYWELTKSGAFGFSNYIPKHAMIWNRIAIACQKRYLGGLLTHINRFNGKRVCDHSCLAFFEMINEPEYPTPAVLERVLVKYAGRVPEPEADHGYSESGLIPLWNGFLSENGFSDSQETRISFTRKLTSDYIGEMFGFADGFLHGRALRTHIWYPLGPGENGLRETAEMLRTAPLDCVSLSWYANAAFESEYLDTRDLLSDASGKLDRYAPLRAADKAFVVYEWNAQSTSVGWPLAAFAVSMASFGVQAAANFTYTPVDVAPYNPGWLVHFLSRRHTPRKAAAFAIGGELFRRLPRGTAPLAPSGGSISTDYGLTLDTAKDITVLETDGLLLHSGKCETAVRSAPDYVSGSGPSPFVSRERNGVYTLERVSPDTLRLTVLPDQFTVGDPMRGKTFKGGMANRYVNVNRECVVSRLYEAGGDVRVSYPGFEGYTVSTEDGAPVPVEGGRFRADPGVYIINAVKSQYTKE